VADLPFGLSAFLGKSSVERGTVVPGFRFPRYSPEQMRSMTAPGLSAPQGSRQYSGIIGSIPPSANGESYRRAELRLGDAARSGGGGGGGGNAGYSLTTGAPAMSAPADRAYQAEKTRAQQLTAQDPLYKKYQVAELTKAYNTAKTPEEKEKIGLQIWAQTNAQLASRLRPGQVGYQEAREAPGMLSGLGQFTSSIQPPAEEVAFPSSLKVSPAAAYSSTGEPLVVATAASFASPENPLEEILSPGVLSDAYSGKLDFDPSALNLDETKRKLLIQAFNRGLK